jgi:hypothetical protein
LEEIGVSVFSIRLKCEHAARTIRTRVGIKDLAPAHSPLVESDESDTESDESDTEPVGTSPHTLVTDTALETSAEQPKIVDAVAGVACDISIETLVDDMDGSTPRVLKADELEPSKAGTIHLPAHRARAWLLLSPT